MSCNTPTTGSTTDELMYWGVMGTDIAPLPNLDGIPYVGKRANHGDSNGTIVGMLDKDSQRTPDFPTDAYGEKYQCPHDTDTYYTTNQSYSAPSAYLTDESRNPGYYQTSPPSSASNALADFDGIGNTAKIIAQRGSKDYSTWTPTPDMEGDYPAASCCNMFYTNGTKQGDWYLPAYGELAYILPKLGKILDSRKNIARVYRNSPSTVTKYERYWSSTEADDSSVMSISTAPAGAVYLWAKKVTTVRLLTVAFLRVPSQL